jgi:anti-sigma regulatory factor (Ser/Thr protein kinase)
VEVIRGLEMRVAEASAAGEARRAAVGLANRLGFDELAAGRVATVVTEVATNLVKHARDGEIWVRGARVDGRDGIVILAMDRGPGMADLARCLADGYSTAGSPGTGLGAIRRMSSAFDVYSDARGTVMMASIGGAGGSLDAFDVGGLSVAYPGETSCGDAWDWVRHDRGTSVLVIDGLGHGAGAADAAEHGVAIFREHAGRPPAELLERIHDGLRATRGAAGAIAEFDRFRRVVRYCGIGNVEASLLANGSSKSLVSHHGILGHQVRRFQELEYPWERGAVGVLHSDGISGRNGFAPNPDVLGHHPLLLAASIQRDHRRGRDDATAVVVRERP